VVSALHGHLPDSHRERTILHLNPTHLVQPLPSGCQCRTLPSAAPPSPTARPDSRAESSRSPSACIPPGRTSRAAAPTNDRHPRRRDCIVRHRPRSSRLLDESVRHAPSTDATGKRPPALRSCGRSVVALYNTRRPHQALANRTPMAVWRGGVTGELGDTAVDMTLVLRTSLDNAAALVSRPAGSHRQPLAEPSVRLAPHWAPIRQTRRLRRAASVRRVQGTFVPASGGSKPRELCVPCSA
jgi:hypothetical protein